MTDDILTRLKEGWHGPDQPCWQCEAANEIERLRAENAVLRKAVGEEGRANRMTILYESAQIEIERLRAEVARLGSFLYPVGQQAGMCSRCMALSEEARRG